MTAAIRTEERFNDEVCETLKADGWLFDGPLPYQSGHACDAGCDKPELLVDEVYRPLRDKADVPYAV